MLTLDVVCLCVLVCVQLRQEKVDLENQLEREQEYVVNKLRKQLAQVCTNFSSLSFDSFSFCFDFQW